MSEGASHATTSSNVRPATRVRMGGPGHGGPAGRLVEKPKDFKGTMRKVLAYLGGYRALLLLVAVFAVASTAFNVVGPKVLSTATTEVFEGAAAKAAGTGGIDFSAIARILGVTIALYVASAACSFVQGWTMATISQRICYSLRRDIDLKIDRMPVGYFERVSTGDVLSRITNDIDTLGHSLTQGVTTLITSMVTLVGVLVMMLLISPLLTLVTLVMIPVAILMVRVVVKRSQRYFKMQQDMLGEINGQVEETFSGHVVVRAFNQEARAIESFDQANAKLYESAWKSHFISGLMMPIMNLISNMGYVAVAVLGSILAVQRAITVGDIQAFIQYVKNFTQPIQHLTQVANVLQSMAAAAERVFEFLDEQEATDRKPTATTQDVRGDVDFDHVRFGYEEGKTVIHDFSAHVNHGQTVAIVGPTGAGKTTMVKLLMRFYEVGDGSIRIDGHDIRDFALDDLRDLFAMVLQDTWLFNGSIRENIRYGKLDATDEEVEEAAKAACAHWFITTLPGGYDFEINEDASNISQGQRQLLTIARAILADRRMLILDEATSSVDTRTEALIQQAMDNLMKGRTSFVIAHRLSTIRDADLILCLDEGDIVEQGSHDQLISAGGYYASLYNSQFAES